MRPFSKRVTFPGVSLTMFLLCTVPFAFSVKLKENATLSVLLTRVSFTDTDKGRWILGPETGYHREETGPRSPKHTAWKRQNAEDTWNMGHTISYQ